MNNKLSLRVEKHLEERGIFKASNINQVSLWIYALIILLATEFYAIFYFFIVIVCRFIKPEDIYQNLITVTAAIAAIIFAIFILISETLRDDKHTYKARVLLQVSNIKIIAIATLIIFSILISFEILHKNTHQPTFLILGVVLVFGLIAYVIRMISKIIKTLSNKQIFEEEKINFIVEGMNQRVDFLIHRRIGKDILNQEFKENLVYDPYFSKKNDDMYFYMPKNTGMINDINLDILSNLIKKLEEKNIPPQTNQDPNKTEYAPSHKYPNIEIIISASYKDLLWDNNPILAIKKSYVDDEIEELIPNIFDIQPKLDYSEIQNSFSIQKDNLITAITNKHTGEIQNLSNQYIEILSRFLNIFHAKWDKYLDNQQIIDIYRDFEEIKNIGQDIRELIEKAIETEDKRSINEIISLPIRISWIALRYDDYFLFRDYIDFHATLYKYATKYEG